MSPFACANRISEPILLIHGEADNNSGTFPVQSERLYQALRGHGATARYVALPHESHGYRARESVLHRRALRESNRDSRRNPTIHEEHRTDLMKGRG